MTSTSREFRVGAAGTLLTEDELRRSVLAAASWRAVLRSTGLTGAGTTAVLRELADAWGIDHTHLDRQDDARLRSVLAASATWAEAMAGLGYAEHSGSARATLRRRARAAGVSTAHLDAPGTRRPVSAFAQARPEAAHLRRAAPYIVAAACELRGFSVSWPLEPVVYDLVVDTGTGGLRRVQVKTATSRQDGGWQAWITRSGRVPYTRDQIDDLAVVDGDQQVHLIPIEAVEGQKGLRLRHYEEYRLTPGPLREAEQGRARRVGLTGFEPATP